MSRYDFDDDEWERKIRKYIKHDCHNDCRRGKRGPQGPQGNTGTQGSNGLRGFQGNTGAQGAQGNTGAQGSVGPQADPGYTVIITPYIDNPPNITGSDSTIVSVTNATITTILTPDAISISGNISGNCTAFNGSVGFSLISDLFNPATYGYVLQSKSISGLVTGNGGQFSLLSGTVVSIDKDTITINAVQNTDMEQTEPTYSVNFSLMGKI
jgi:hypothetical protein